VVGSGIKEQHRKAGIDGFENGNSKMGNQEIVIRQRFPESFGVQAAAVNDLYAPLFQDSYFFPVSVQGTQNYRDGQIRRSRGPQNPDCP
jgi:hypothetical protein